MTASRKTITLPSNFNMFSMREFLGEVYLEGNECIDFDLSACNFIEPVGMVALSCLIELMKVKNIEVNTINGSNDSLNYLKRMGFFDVLGLDGPSPVGEYRPPNGRFSCLKRVGDDNDTDDITHAIVDTLGLDSYGDEWRTVSYIISELINNVCHHSRSYGFALAQYYEKTNCVKISIGDPGIGLKEALRERYYDDVKTHGDAINKALEPLITSNPPHFGQPERRNRGVGLSMVHRLVMESRGKLQIYSGTAMLNGNDMFSGQPMWQGTLVSVRLERGKISADIKKFIGEMLNKGASEIE